MSVLFILIIPFGIVVCRVSFHPSLEIKYEMTLGSLPFVKDWYIASNSYATWMTKIISDIMVCLSRSSLCRNDILHLDGFVR